jgi:hypothetical protein
MVRNEADIIESFVRHTLGLVDGIAVLDHASIDGTFETLGRLKAQGLQIARLRTTESAFFQGSRITELARECFARTGADYVIPLDADEFLRTPSRQTMQAALAEVPTPLYPVHHWQSYVPTSFDGVFGPGHLRRRLRTERVRRHKAVIPRRLIEEGHVVSEGSHWILDPRTVSRLPCQPVADDRLAIAHCPVRSARQLEAKVRVGYPALKAAAGHNTPGAFHWRDLHDRVAAGQSLTQQDLYEIACNYTVPPESWVPAGEIELVEDPVELLGQ